MRDREQRDAPENNTFTRGQNVVKADTEPFQRKPRDEDNTMMSRSGFGGQKAAPTQDRPSEKKTGPPSFTRSGNAPAKKTGE